MADAKVAFVTGASRGIGKAIALHLASAGFDVAVSARTEQEGEAREHSSTLRQSNTSPLPGSLSETAALVEEAGARVLTAPADLLDRASLGAAIAIVLERWGRIDVLVNNGRYVGPGHMDFIVDTPLELLDKHLQANVMSPLVLIKQVLPSMLARGSGTIINVSSASGLTDPPAPAGKGGWGLGYGFSKAAAYRIAGMLALEMGDRGILAYNLEPGFVATERIAIDMAPFGFNAADAIPTDVPGAVTAWLVTAPEAAEPNGRTVYAPDVCRDLGLLSGWP